MENRNRNSDIEKLTRAAKADYEKFTREKKKLVLEWFNSMDTDGNGKISLDEFKDFFTQETGIKPIIFYLFDRNGDGNLQFEEVIALFCYCEFGKSQCKGRPTCNGCGNWIINQFFTCKHCRLVDNVNYDLCGPCYESNQVYHRHKDLVNDYEMLNMMQKMISSGERVESQISFDDQKIEENKTRRRKRDLLKKVLKFFGKAAASAALAEILKELFCS